MKKITGKNVFLIVLIAILGAVGFFYFIFPSLLLDKFDYQVRNEGLKNLKYDVIESSLGTLRVENVTFDYDRDDKVLFKAKIPNIVVRYTMRTMLQQHLQSVTMDNPEITVTFPSQYDFTARERVARFQFVPIETLTINSYQIHLLKTDLPKDHLILYGNALMTANDRKIDSNLDGNFDVNHFYGKYHFNIIHRFRSDRGKAEFLITMPKFTEQRFKSVLFFPDSVVDLKLTDGQFYSEGSFEWQGTAENAGKDHRYDLEMKESFHAEKISGQYGDLYFSGLNADLTLYPLEDFKSDPYQILTVDGADVSVPLKDINFYYELKGLIDGEPHIFIYAATAKLADGDVAGRDIDIKLSEPKQSFKIYLNELDLDKIMRYVNEKEWRATGKVSGILPVTITSAGVIIENGQVAARKPGMISYMAPPPKSFLKAGKAGQVFMQVLQNFQYQFIVLIVNHDLGDETSIQAQIIGRNPKALYGFPIKLNMNVTGPLFPLLRAINEKDDLVDVRYTGD